MKKSKLSMLLFTPLVLGALAGCDIFKKDEPKGDEPKEEVRLPDEYSLMKHWAGNQGEEVYTVNETDAATEISYTDAMGEMSGGWEYVMRSFAFDSTSIAKFSEYKKITFTGKLETTSGSNVVMVKVQGEGGTFEKKFNFSSEVSTYEFGLSFVSDWTKVDAMLFFVDRETSESGSGKITLSKCALSKAEIVDEYNIAKGMPSVPQDWNIYNGGDEFSITNRWGYDATEEIKTEAADGAVAKFSWNGMTQDWAYVSAMIKGSETNPLMTSGFKRMLFKVNGTEGQEVLFKFQTKDNAKAKEVRATLTGADQEVEVDVTEVLAASADDQFLACIFPAPGAHGAELAGEMILKEAKMDKTAVYVEPAKNRAAWGELFFDEYKQKDPCFTVENANHISKISVNKANTGWESIQYLAGKQEDWFNLGDYTKVYARVSSTKATHVLLKIYDSKEIWVELAAGETKEINETIDSAIVDEAKVSCVFISTNDGDALDPVVTIEHFKLYRANAINIGASNEGDIEMLTGAGEFASSSIENGFKIAYEKAAPGWANVEGLVSADYNKVNSIRGTLKSTVDTHVMIKPGDAVELKFELKANQPLDFDRQFSVSGTWASKIVLFICYEDADALVGEVSFTNIHMYANANGVSSLPNKGSYGAIFVDNYFRADDCYNLSREGHNVSIDFNIPEFGWQSMAAHLTLGDTWYAMADYKKVSASLVSDVDANVLLKAFDKNTGEHWVNLIAGVEQYVEFVLADDVAEAGKDFIVFVQPVLETQGTVTIKSLAVSRVNSSIEQEDGKCYVEHLSEKTGYTVTTHEDHKGMTVHYSVENTGYDFFEYFVCGKAYNHITVVAQSDASTHVLLKPNDNGANEKLIELPAGEEVTIEFDVPSPSMDEQWACKQIMFFATNGGDALEANVNFKVFAYSFVEAE